VDLLVSKLPNDADSIVLRKIAGSKQVISAQVKDDRTGYLQVRLQQGETLD
jgi:hypothetical protein